MKIQIRDIEFNVDVSFQPEYWEYVNSGKWEPNTFDIIDHCIKANMNVMDIGCWIGPLSLYMAGKGAAVYAIDPDPKAYEFLLNNLKLNPEFNRTIKPFNIAITNKNGFTNLYARSDYGNSSTSLLNRTRDKINDVSCEGLSLDKFFKNASLDQIDFMKVDIEGGEFIIIDQLLTVKKQYGCTNLLLSLHYDQLNEFIYKQKLGNRTLSLIMMKLERFLGIYVFKKDLVDYLNGIASLSLQYKFVYAENGEQLEGDKRTPNYFLKKKINLFMTDYQWNKQ